LARFNLLPLEEILNEKARSFFSNAISEFGNIVNELSGDENLLNILVLLRVAASDMRQTTNKQFISLNFPLQNY